MGQPQGNCVLFPDFFRKFMVQDSRHCKKRNGRGSVFSVQDQKSGVKKSDRKKQPLGLTSLSDGDCLTLLLSMSPRLGSFFFVACWALLLYPRAVEAVTAFSLFQYAPTGGLYGVNGTDGATCTPIVPLTDTLCA